MTGMLREGVKICFGPILRTKVLANVGDDEAVPAVDGLARKSPGYSLRHGRQALVWATG